VVYATAEEKEQALQAKSEIEKLESRRDRIQDRMKELRPPVRRTDRLDRFGSEEETEIEEEE